MGTALQEKTPFKTVVSGYIRLQGAIAQSDTYWAMHHDFTIGRADDQDVVLENRSVSRAHAEITLTRQGWVLRDLDSTNGTFLNGERVGREGRVISSGDMLRIGTVVLFVADLIEGLPEEMVV